MIDDRLGVLSADKDQGVGALVLFFSIWRTVSLASRTINQKPRNKSASSIPLRDTIAASEQEVIAAHRGSFSRLPPFV